MLATGRHIGEVSDDALLDTLFLALPLANFIRPDLSLHHAILTSSQFEEANHGTHRSRSQS